MRKAPVIYKTMRLAHTLFCLVFLLFVSSVLSINRHALTNAEGDVDLTKSNDATKTEPSNGAVENDVALTAQNSELEEKEIESYLDVIELTSRNFSQHVSNFGSNSVWLIEFYSPNCVHCVEFASQYAEIGMYYHRHSPKSRRRSIRVAKINGEQERALASRFGIYGFPSFFIIDGWSVYKFEEPRSKKRLMAFTEGGYKKTVSIPFYSSPMGPLGQFQGGLMYFGHILFDLFEWAQITFHLSPLIVGMIIFGSMFMGCFVVIVMLALVIPERPKRD